MKKSYKILWIDDEFDTDSQEQFSVRAERNGIYLDGFKSARKGIRELEDNLEKYDGILLDAIFFDEYEDSDLENVSIIGFGKVWDRIKELYHKRALPVWIRSGRPDYTNEKSFKERYKDVPFFDKKDPTHSDRLFSQIKEDADQIDHTQIRHKFYQVFQSCNSKYLDDGVQSILMDILLHVEGKTPANSTDSYFNSVRQIIEAVFQSANRYGLLHNKCITKGKVNITEACYFLSGQETIIHSTGERVKSTQRHFPELIYDAVRNILKISNAGSHFENEREIAKMHIKELKQYVNEPYLLHSITFQLLDVLLWFKEYIDQHPDPEKNRELWQDLTIEGYVQRDDKGKYFVNDCELQAKNNSLNVGDKVKIIRYEKNGNPNNYYKYFTRYFEKAN